VPVVTVACAARDTLVIGTLEKGYGSEAITVCPYPVAIGIVPLTGPIILATVDCIALYSEKSIGDPSDAIFIPYNITDSTNLTSVESFVSIAIANTSAY
jgi:hypothetical protein